MCNWLIAIRAVLLLVLPGTAGGATLHVAPLGSDEATGTQAAPLASLAGARDRVRKLKTEHPGEPIIVLFAPGSYPLSVPVAFGADDSGSADAPILYRAQPGGEVRITGGRACTGWERVADGDAAIRLPDAARPHVRVADLRQQSITDYGELAPRGFAMPSPVAEMELFYEDEPMRPARWPNQGFRGVEGMDGPARIKVDTDRVARWVDEPAPWIFAYWHHDWADLFEPLAGIDAEAGVLIRTREVIPRYGVTPERARWYAFNLLSELDEPGEYYLDRDAGRLYFWPPRPAGRAILSQVESLVRARNLEYVTFQGFIFEACRGTAVSIDDGAACRIVGCTLRNVGHRAVSVNGGTNHEVIGCDVYHCGEGGLSLTGGDRKSLTPAGHNAENNHVHHYSRRGRTYHTAISVSGVGNRIAHNLIHDGPHMALSAPGNDHVVEFNEIHNVVYESGDAGAYYVGRDWTQRGNILRYNYWHDIAGSTGYGGMTIYLDDQHCGHTISGNLFERCSQAVFIGGGDDNIVTNNVFRECRRAAHIDNRGMGWQKATTDDPNWTLRTRLRAMPIQSEPWARRYPTLPGILEDEPNIPKRNVIARNISAGGTWDHLHAGTLSYQHVENNLVFDDDPEWVTLETNAAGRLVRLVFKDPDAVRRIGFQDIPVERMGLYPDERRASWPVAHPVRRQIFPP